MIDLRMRQANRVPRGLPAVGIFLLTAAAASPALAQDPPERETYLSFNFREASLQAVLVYMTRATGYTFVVTVEFKGTVTAVSDAKVPRVKALDFLNGVLKPKGFIAIPTVDNPNVIEITTVDEARRRPRPVPIRVGADPSSIEPGDHTVTQVVPLQGLDVADFDRDLKAILPKTAEVAKDSVNNSLILTDTADNVRKFLTLLSHLEGMKYEPLRFRVVELKNVDPADASRFIQEFVRKDAAGGAGRQALSWQKAWFPDSPVQGDRLRRATSEIIKAIPDPKGNSIVLAATEENLRLIESLIAQIDKRGPSTAQIKIYHPRGAGVKEVSEVVSQLFRPDPQGAQPGAGRQPRQLQWWDADEVADVVAAYPVKTLANPISNTLLVVATAEQVKLIDRVVESLDVARSAKIYQLRFADAKQTAEFVAQFFKAQQADVSALADARTNAVVVTASEEQMAVLDGVINEMDRQLQESLAIRIFPVKNVPAEEVAATIATALKPASPPAGVALRPVETHVIKSTNSILVRGPDHYFKLIEELIAHHESAPREEQVTLVTRLKNASAGSVLNVLKAVRGASAIEAESPLPPAMPPLPASEGKGKAGEMPYQPSQEQPGGPQDKGAAPTGRAQDAQSDEGSNVVVVRAPAREIPAIKSMIAELDQYRPQVLIRVLITEVSLDKELQYGVEAFLEDKLKGFGSDRSALQRFETKFGLPTTGFGYALTAADFGATLRALADEGKLKVLATPRILALDNQPATLSIGRKIPFITSSRQTPEGSVLNTVQYTDLGIILKVTPRIAGDGLVTMYVRPEVSGAAPVASSVPLGPGVVAPVFDSNYAETTVTVKSRQTVILGGLIRESEEDAHVGVPILGDLPLIGLLFSHTVKRSQRRELMIFITPEVVSTAAELEELTAIEKGQLRLIDQREISSEMKRWLRGVR